MKKVIPFDSRTKIEKISGQTDAFFILNSLSQAVISVIDHKIVFANDAVEALFGWRPVELVGQDWGIIHRTNEEYEKIGQDLFDAVERKQTFSKEYKFRCKDGKEIECNIRASLLEDRFNEKKIIVTYEDVADRTRQIDELYAVLTKSSQIAFYVAQDGKIVIANPQGAEEAGCPVSEIIGKDSQAFIHPEDKDRVRKQGIMMLKGELKSPIEFRYINKGGQLRWGIGMMTPINYKGRRAVLGNYVDITERKMAEAELVYSRQQLRDLAAHLQSVREDERTRVAHEIHDDLGQTLTILKMDLAWLTKKLPQNEVSINEKTLTMSKLIDMSIHTVRRISMELKPWLLDNLGLAAAIEWQAEEFQRRTGIKCEVSIDQEKIIWDQKLSTAICNILQEILLNVLRHANATRVNIDLREKEGRLELAIRDNGKGITEEQICKSNSFGLIGIRERILSLGGVIEISGKKSKGTTIVLRIPFNKNDSGMMYKIFIADVHPIFREGIKQIISDIPDMIVTGEACNVREMLEQISKADYDIILLDISLMGRCGLDIVKDIKIEKPKLPILVLSMYPEEQYAIRTLKAGAAGYLSKESASVELIAAIRKILQGKKYVSASLAERLALELDAFSMKPLHEKLSDREYQIMLMIASGKTVGEIAKELYLSVKTISTYRSRIMEKMKMKKNAVLTRYAIDNLLLD